MNNQQLAINKITGPCVIFAGAGTGKTYTIVEKIKKLVNEKIFRPERILCLTFSNEAVKSLSIRILNNTSTESQPIVRTFHGFCADILRKYGKTIGIDEKFKILLPDDAKIMLHKSFQTTPYNCHQYVESIGIAKDLGIDFTDLESYINSLNNKSLEELSNEIESLTLSYHTAHINKNNEKKNSITYDLEDLNQILKMKKFLQTWKAYEKLKQKKNFQDYSDLNKNALILLDKNPEIAKEFDYVIIDEFQDTNKLQCDLIKKLSPDRNITIVGDMNQSIYRFRGAYKDNLVNFMRDFDVQETDKFILDKSYRSTNKILRTASNLIRQNINSYSEHFDVLNHQNTEGENVKTYELLDQREEVRKIIELIKEEIDAGTPLTEICVMFRTHQQARMLKTALEEEDIPYTSVAKKSLLKSPPIRKVLNYMTILQKLKNKSRGGDQAWWDLVFKSGFSEKDLITISKYLKSIKTDDCPSLRMLNDYSEINLTDDGKIRMQIIITTIKDLIPHLNLNLKELIMRIYSKTEFSTPEHPGYKENVLALEKFLNIAEEFPENELDLESFMRHIEIVNNLGIEIDAPQAQKDGVRIMTNHSTKGLEYEAVIIGSLAQKRFPISNIKSTLIPLSISPEIKPLIAGKKPEEIDLLIHKHEEENQLFEERRLCYVAFTRAKKRLYLTYAKEYGSRKHYPSQFLLEIKYKENPDVDFIEDLEVKPFIKQTKNTKEISLDSWSSDSLINKIVFSPSALQTFCDCQKRYEYKYIYNMPDPAPVSWDAMKLGSFIHLVVEKGVKANYKTEKEFLDLAKALQMDEEWNFVNLQEALPIIRVFFIRNKDKYNEKSLTEQKLDAKIEGLKFFGIADRIDFHEDGIEIVDYKTGSSDIKPQYRNWQLGFYALAAQKFGIPRKLTLDMLKKEKPIEFVLEDNGNAKEINSKRMSFNLYKVKEEMLQTAREIIRCYSQGFRPCSQERNCAFCNEYFWEN